MSASSISGVSEVVKNINLIFDRRTNAALKLCEEYALLALNYFREVQKTGIGNKGKFWTNFTEQAANRWFTRAFLNTAKAELGWFAAHGVDYGLYLETANSRQNESLKPVVSRYAGRFLRDMNKLYGKG